MFFKELQSLLELTGDLQVTMALGSQCKLKVCVVPPVSTGKTGNKIVPLMLSGTHEELEAGFADAVKAYATAHKTVAEQAAAAAKAMTTQSTSKANKGGKGNAAESAPDADDDDDDDAPPPASSNATSPSTDTKGTDLLSLLG